MSISYSALRTDRKVTLPSVTNWGSNANILKDPPKSIHTRKIDKVGQTSSLTQMIEEAGDRSADAINFYPRGVNPMVAVSYSNASNNGARTTGIIQQARYPYRTNDAFRPPIQNPEDLFPLSRLPRIWTSAFTQPGFADFSKKMMIQTEEDGKTKGAKANSRILRSDVKPTIFIKTNIGLEEPYETKNSIMNNKISVEGFSGVRTLDKFGREIGEFRNVINDRESMNVETNIGKQSTYAADELINFDVGMHILNNPIHTSTEGFVSGPTKNEYIHGDIYLNKNLPVYQAETNVSKNIYVNNSQQDLRQVVTRPTTQAFTNVNMVGDTNVSSKQYVLKPKISVGGFDGEIGTKINSDYHNGNDSVNLRQTKSDQRKGTFIQMRG